MRATGRTSRIADFAVNELFSVGEVIVTDHTMFEGFTPSQHMLHHLIDKVKLLIEVKSYGRLSCESKIKKIR